MKTTFRPWLVAGMVAASALWGGAALAATPYVSATVEGALTPGVYGRIDIGNAPPPPLIYAQPIIIQRPPVLVQQAPLYLHVPPGHAKNWSKHCAKYNACGQSVYFVKVRGDEDHDDDHDGAREWRKDKYHGNDKGHGHGKGHGRNHDD